MIDVLVTLVYLAASSATLGGCVSHPENLRCSNGQEPAHECRMDIRAHAYTGGVHW